MDFKSTIIPYWSACNALLQSNNNNNSSNARMRLQIDHKQLKWKLSSSYSDSLCLSLSANDSPIWSSYNQSLGGLNRNELAISRKIGGNLSVNTFCIGEYINP